MGDQKYLKEVVLNSDVYAVCLQHALSTESEEIMGLLIGYVDESERVSYITACKILRRLDKQPDRVEISPDQLMTATTYAENLSASLCQDLRVVGWYHSHPHITVWPSHVDIQTQALYQTMDRFFIGLIFSVYPKDSGSVDNQVQLTAFQSLTRTSEPNRLKVKLVIQPSPFLAHNLEALAELPRIFVGEEIENQRTEGDCEEDLLAKWYNDAIRTQKRIHIIDKITLPMYECLDRKLLATTNRIKELRRIVQKLECGEQA